MHLYLRSVAALCLGVAIAACTQVPAIAQQPPIALRGTVVTPSGPVEHGIVLVEAGAIKGVGKDLPLPPGVRVVETHGTIYPGLIDLHDHVTWNVLSRWSSGVKSGARYDWQQLPEYRMALDVPHAKMVAEGHGCAAERYAEIKAIAGGATSQAGLGPRDLSASSQTVASPSTPAGCLAGMIRELGVTSRLYAKGASEKLRYEVFPLALDPSRAAALISDLHDGTVNAALFHIAEGASDNASARREFGMLQARGLLLPGVSIIHGVALSKSNFAAMAQAGVGLVWSPRSNFELYGSTADVADAKSAGVKMAIAPDWSPTGSDGMLQELKYAAVWNATQDPAPFTDRELFEMATRNAAQLGGIAAQVGAIETGMRADLLVLVPAGTTSDDPYSQLVHSSPEDVGLVLVDGLPVYGDEPLMKHLVPESGSASFNICGRPKKIALPAGFSWQATTEELTSALHRWDAALSPLAECR